MKLKDGYYIELAPRFGAGNIKIHRNTKKEIQSLMRQYQANKAVKYLGKMKDGKWTEK